jgi:hypothetical protein
MHVQRIGSCQGRKSKKKGGEAGKENEEEKSNGKDKCRDRNLRPSASQKQIFVFPTTQIVLRCTCPVLIFLCVRAGFCQDWDVILESKEWRLRIGN